MLKPALPSYTIYSNSLRPCHPWHFTGFPSPSFTRFCNTRISSATYTYYVFYTLHWGPYIHQLSIHTLSCQKMTSLFSCYLDMRRYSQLAQQSRYDGTASIVSKNCYLIIKKFTNATQLTNRPKFSTVFTLTYHKKIINKHFDMIHQYVQNKKRSGRKVNIRNQNKCIKRLMTAW